MNYHSALNHLKKPTNKKKIGAPSEHTPRKWRVKKERTHSKLNLKQKNPSELDHEMKKKKVNSTTIGTHCTKKNGERERRKNRTLPS